MTTISDMLAPRSTAPPKSSVGALSFSAPQEGRSAFASVLDDVADARGRPKPAPVDRQDRESIADTDESTTQRLHDDGNDEEAQAASQAGEEEAEAATSDSEEDEAYVPIADASLVPVEPETGEEAEAQIAPAQQPAPWQRAAEGEGRQVSGNGRVATSPAEIASAQSADAVQMTAGGQAMGEQMDSALDLLTAQELMAPDQIQVETEGGELFERLQQALATGSAALADDVGEVVVPQVVRNMAALARNGISEMRLQLQPGDLGEIELRVRAIEGVVRGEVMVQHPEVKALLENQMERLRTALALHGLQLEGFDVDVSDQGAQARGDGDRDVDGRTRGGLMRDTERGDEELVDATLPPSRPVRLDPNANDWLV